MARGKASPKGGAPAARHPARPNGPPGRIAARRFVLRFLLASQPLEPRPASGGGARRATGRPADALRGDASLKGGGAAGGEWGGAGHRGAWALALADLLLRDVQSVAKDFPGNPEVQTFCSALAHELSEAMRPHSSPIADDVYSAKAATIKAATLALSVRHCLPGAPGIDGTRARGDIPPVRHRHRRRPALAARAFAPVLFLVACAASAQMSGYSYLDDDGVMLLTSVSVRHGGGERVYDASKLLSPQTVGFLSASSPLAVVPAGQPTPGPGERAGLLDRILNSGLLNPSRAARPEAAGLRLRFAAPVPNRPGPDLVVFELQTDAGNSPLGGDAFRLAAVAADGRIWSGEIGSFDIGFAHPAAQRVLSGRLFSRAGAPAGTDGRDGAWQDAGSTDGTMLFKVLGTAVDLALLGVPEGTEILELAIQQGAAARAAIDPVCVAALPDPVPANLLAAAPPNRKAPQKPILAPLLDGPLSHLREVVFAVRAPGTDHWYANFGFYSAPTGEYPPQRAPGGKVVLPPIYKRGGQLAKLDLRTRQATVLLADREGAVRDPAVDYDGRSIFFSYRPAGTDFYHLYEIQADGSGLRQITDGPFNDIEPACLPDGTLVFCSDRSNRFVNCWRTPVATLYRCARDGGELRMLSSNVEHDNTPWPLPDGRFLYMRWEYVDRNQNVFHHLWTAAPDGTGQMVYYGNMHPGTAMLDAKPVPGTRQVVASFSPGHGQAEHQGHITLVDPSLGPDHRPSARRISRDAPVYRDPYPLGDGCFLVAADSRLLAMDGRGRTETVHALPAAAGKVWLHEPRPLLARPREPAIPDRTVREDAMGTYFLGDIHVGRQMEGVTRGEVKELLILEQLPKPVNFSGGMWPISAGGTFTLARILGTVPVRPDGSAHFRAPALRSLFFVALDKDRLSVKRMHSFTTLQPGENMGCVGCHESRLTTPLARNAPALAMRPGPDEIRPVADVPDVPDFPRDVQPILDRHCIACHNSDARRGGLDLSGDRTPLFSRAYWSLTRRGLYADGRNAMRSNFPPRQVGSGSSRLLAYLDGSHHGARTSAAERAAVWAWIEAGAPYAGTYAALGSGMAPVVFPEEVVEKRCASCHGEPAKRPIGGRKICYRFGGKGPALPLASSMQHLRDIRAMVGYYRFGQSPTPQSLCNLDRPEKSPLLLAHLAKAAGGWELGGRTVFADLDDADCQAILAAIRQAAGRLRESGRFDLPGFRPNDYYLHQMRRYGILRPGVPEDGYLLDHVYWQSFHYRP